jgi:hypothetical protein
MAETPNTEHRDPLNRLSVNIFCEIPDVKDLSLEQKFALHEFFHIVLAAGYKLYQIVPAELAAPIIRKKFLHMIEGE